MAVLPRPVTMTIWSQPAAMASSTPYWMMGLSTSGSISLGMALVAGKNRVPNPAAGNTALRTFCMRRRILDYVERIADYRLLTIGGAHKTFAQCATLRPLLFAGPKKR